MLLTLLDQVLYYMFLGCGRDSSALTSADLNTVVKVRPWSSSSLTRTILGEQKEKDRECRHVASTAWSRT